MIIAPELSYFKNFKNSEFLCFGFLEFERTSTILLEAFSGVMTSSFFTSSI
jgi:hypothetical protein